MIRTRSQVRVAENGRVAKLIPGNPQPQVQTRSAFANRSRNLETANSGGFGNFSQSTNLLGANPALVDLMLTGMAADTEESNYRFYRDIYFYDATAGSVVDMQSTIPFSDFDLIGPDDSKIDVYNRATERLNLKTLFPQLTVDYLVMGEFIGSLVLDNKSKNFTDLIYHSSADSDIVPHPFRSATPTILVKQSENVKKFLASSSDGVKKYLQQIDPSLLASLKATQTELDAGLTLYVPRRTLTGYYRGVSLYKRILPLYFLEKTLFRGTLVQAGRRQQSLLHLEIGDETWEAQREEMEAVVAMFQQADQDPLGAIVATRRGVTPNETRMATDGWKWTDIVDIINPVKLRALGTSESFLTGEMSFASADVNLTVFLENMKSFRQFVTQTVMYDTIFPKIAVLNGFIKKKSDTASVHDTLNDSTRYDIPEVQWHKQLSPRADTNYFDALEKMAEHGVPVSLRAWAAAGGMDLDSAVREAEKENELHARIDKLTKNGSQGEEFAGLGMRRALLNRKLDPTISAFTKTGKRKHVFDQASAQRKANVEIMDSVARLSDPNYYQTTLKLAQEKNHVRSV